jgi:hypothetical protein
MVIIEDNGIGRKRSAQLKRLKEKIASKFCYFSKSKATRYFKSRSQTPNHDGNY